MGMHLLRNQSAFTENLNNGVAKMKATKDDVVELVHQ